MSVGKWFVILSDHGKIERVKISKKINRISITGPGVFFCTGTVRVFERVLFNFFFHSGIVVVLLSEVVLLKI